MENILKGKIALVTGGTRGIGKAITEQLRTQGAQVIVTARTAPETTANGIHFIAADLTLPDAAEQLAATILAEYGQLDIVVNNAGANLNSGGGFSTLSEAHWFSDWNLNFMAVVRLNKAILPSMLARKSGAIINISTDAAKQPIWEMTMSYSAAKAALNIYSKALVNELGPQGIRVNVVSPGVVETPLMLEFIAGMANASNITTDQAYQEVMEKVGVPLGRMAEPSEVAKLVVFLASPCASYITGVNYSVDGGALPIV